MLRFSMIILTVILHDKALNIKIRKIVRLIDRLVKSSGWSYRKFFLRFFIN